MTVRETQSMPRLSPIASCVLLLLSGCTGLCATVGQLADPATVAPSLTGQALAVLETHCVECHGGKATRHDLDLTTREGLLRGGKAGVAVVVGKAEESLLYKKIKHADAPGMPYKRERLSAAEIKLIGQWINDGAVY